MKKLLVGVALPVLLSAAINVYARQLTVVRRKRIHIKFTYRSITQYRTQSVVTRHNHIAVISTAVKDIICRPVLIRQPERTESAERNTVAPLVTTIWNQTAPYNDQCPLSLGRKSVTGCVATAMAQIVNYHNWPQGTGAGTYSYTIKLISLIVYEYVPAPVPCGQL